MCPDMYSTKTKKKVGGEEQMTLIFMEFCVGTFNANYAAAEI